jgi:uncharacterized protein YceH (UPF0502 family)
VDADVVEVRVLGCLIEKQRATPDQYPLTLNSLRLAANQATNRDPVVDYDEPMIRAALDRLGRRGWSRLTSGPGSRVAKFRHLLDEALQLTQSQLALLAVLMLRGPQTVGELRTRSVRLYPFPSPREVELALDELASRELVQRLPRRAGEREERWLQLLGEAAPTVGTLSQTEPRTPLGPHQGHTDLEERVARLEQRLTELEQRLNEPRA